VKQKVAAPLLEKVGGFLREIMQKDGQSRPAFGHFIFGWIWLRADPRQSIEPAWPRSAREAADFQRISPAVSCDRPGRFFLDFRAVIGPILGAIVASPATRRHVVGLRSTLVLDGFARPMSFRSPEAMKPRAAVI
jgi:hypothetical protein